MHNQGWVLTHLFKKNSIQSTQRTKNLACCRHRSEYIVFYIFASRHFVALKHVLNEMLILVLLQKQLTRSKKQIIKQPKSCYLNTRILSSTPNVNRKNKMQRKYEYCYFFCINVELTSVKQTSLNSKGYAHKNSCCFTRKLVLIRFYPISCQNTLSILTESIRKYLIC